MKRYALTLDLKNDPALIAEYEEHHKAVWPRNNRFYKRSGYRKHADLSATKRGCL